LNLVRLKYRDESYFLKIDSVTASFSFDGNAGLGANSSIDMGPVINSVSPSLGVSYSDSPTISYQPLQGEDFLKSILSPIPLDSLLVMTQSGWNIERVFGLCVERINNVLNAPTASGPTPIMEPEFKKFNRLLVLLKQLQANGSIEVGVSPYKGSELVLLFQKLHNQRANIYEMAELLELNTPADKAYVKVGTNFINSEPGQLIMRTRSISSILFYLSQNINIPQEHVEGGLITLTKTKTGDFFDWAEVPAGKNFNVKVSSSYPDKAFLAIPYRNYWFYIDDNDLQSKSTFMLLMQLFDLQAGKTQASGPTLTIPVR